MSGNLLPPDADNETEMFPLEPRFHPINRVARIIYDKLASAKLAMFLLIAILVSCLCGGLYFKDETARQLIYGSLWFNGLLILLVINVACCFFGRIWGRRVTVISFGMILFHLSFVVMFLAVVLNSLFGFDGVLKMTEGETVSNRDPQFYDNIHRGLFFSYSRLKGETSLLKVHRGFKVDGGEKNIAYDISVNQAGAIEKKGTIYVNNKFVFNDVEYFRDSEGYSVLVILNDKHGNELYGMHTPLQSIKQKNGSYIYSTGTKTGPVIFNFPPEPGKERFGLQADYFADAFKDRTGKVRFQVWPLADRAGGHGANPMADTSAHIAAGPHNMNTQAGGASVRDGSPDKSPVNHDAAGISTDMQHMNKLAEGTVAINEKLAFGEYLLSPREVRYWVGMKVLYSPGKPIVMVTLWIGLSGLIITAIGRFMRARK